MDKVTLLTASRVEPKVFGHALAPLVAHLSPIFQSAVQLQTILGVISLQLLLNACLAASVSLAATLSVGRVCAVQAWLAARNGAWVSGKVLRWTWTSRAVVKFREQTFRNLATFILGSGNGLILMVFWPGWWVLGGTTWAIWIFYG